MPAFSANFASSTASFAFVARPFEDLAVSPLRYLGQHRLRFLLLFRHQRAAAVCTTDKIAMNTFEKKFKPLL